MQTVQRSKNWADDESSDEGDFEPETSELKLTPEPAHKDRPSNDYAQRQPRRQHVNVPSEGPFYAVVNNLAYSLTKDDIGDYFYDGGCEVVDVRIRCNDAGKFDGTARIEFASAESLSRALLADGTMFCGRQIRVNVYYEKPQREVRREPSRDQVRDQGRPHRADRDRAPIPDSTPKSWDRGAKIPEKSATQDLPAAPIKTTPEVVAAPPAPPTRQKLNLQPRSIPINVDGNIARPASIFGEGKPREDVAKKPEDKVEAQVQ